MSSAHRPGFVLSLLFPGPFRESNSVPRPTGGTGSVLRGDGLHPHPALRLCLCRVGFFLVRPVPEGYFSRDLLLHKMVPCPVFPQDRPCPQDHVNLSISPGVHRRLQSLTPLRGSLLLLSPCSGRSQFLPCRYTVPFKGCFKWSVKHEVVGGPLSSHLPSLCLTQR